MNIQSLRAKEIDVYIAAHSSANVGNWPIEIGGEKHVLPYYKLPTKLLCYNASNGRLAMEKRDWEARNNRELDPLNSSDAIVIRELLLGLDTDKTEILRTDIDQKGQMEPGVITHDGFVINGNRRMAIVEVLHEKASTGKWEVLEVVRLPPETSERELWKIEAGLQLSKDKIAEYHPVNELLKIQQGVKAGLSLSEVAAAMYGRTEDEVKDALQRLNVIDQFLNFFGQPGNYGLIKKFGLHEYFVDVQKNVMATWDRQDVPQTQRVKQLNYAFALIRAGILVQDNGSGKKKSGITHWDIRKLGKIFSDIDARDAYLQHLKQTGKNSKEVLAVPSETVIEDFRAAEDILRMKEQRDQPVKLVEKAIAALESIDCGFRPNRTP